METNFIERREFSPYVLGIPEIDHDHKDIFGLMYKLADPDANKQETYHELVQIAAKHLDTEAHLMGFYKYPYYESHMIANLELVRAVISIDPQQIDIPGLNRIIDLFLRHTDSYDRMLANFIITHRSRRRSDEFHTPTSPPL